LFRFFSDYCFAVSLFRLKKQNACFAVSLFRSKQPKQPKQRNNETKILHSALNPNEDFGENENGEDVASFVVVNANLQEEITSYLSISGLEGKKEWERITGHVPEGEYATQTKFSTFWSEKKTLFPRLARLSQFVRNLVQIHANKIF
jgi:hypothetical protein